MGVTLLLLACVGIYWMAAGRPRIRGRMNGRRVYLRQGPGLGGILIGIIALMFLTAHMAVLVSLLLIFALIAGVGVAAIAASRRITRRGR